MDSELPEDVDCRRLLADGGTLNGTVGRHRLSRIGGIFRVRGDADARVQLVIGSDGAMVAHGYVAAPLEAQCQRCLDWMDLDVRGDFELDIVENEAASEDDGTTVLVISAGRLPVRELLEDEILLACPMVPRHKNTACGGQEPIAASGDSPERRKPFAALGDMIKAQQNDD